MSTCLVFIFEPSGVIFGLQVCFLGLGTVSELVFPGCLGARALLPISG